MEKDYQTSIQHSSKKIQNRITYPDSLREFIGQKTTVQTLLDIIKTYDLNEKILDHILLFGPAGLGKTTLAKLIAKESQSQITIVSSTTLKSAEYAAQFIIKLKRGEIFFIDEIHGLPTETINFLLPVMQDFRMEFGFSEKRIQPFTVIGASTSGYSLPRPLRDRFTFMFELELYTELDIAMILLWVSSEMIGSVIDTESALFIAKRSLQTPRIAINRLKLIWVKSIAENKPINVEFIENKFIELGIDNKGLTKTHRNILKYLASLKKPASEATLRSAIDIDKDDMAEFERGLIQNKMIMKSSRGREITDMGHKHLEENKNAV
jgi:Holliday junction DNA helicase RuvB